MATADFDWVIQMVDIYQMVTDRVLRVLETGHIPWKKPWNTSWPSNIVTKKQYQGINMMLLSCTEYDQPFWCTFRQANQLGGSIIRGEKAVSFVVFAKDVVYIKKDEEGNEIPKRGFVLKYSPVFNIEQTTGIEMPVTIEVEVIEAEEYLERAKAKPMIRYGGDRAFYYPEGDCIQLPLKSQFTSSQGYYETFFHEIGHWTGQSSRLNRNLCTEQTARAREELTAEMFAGFCLHKVGVNSDINNVAAYIQSWIRALENDKKALLWASREARKAVQYFESGIIPDSIILSINNN